MRVTCLCSTVVVALAVIASGSVAIGIVTVVNAGIAVFEVV